MVKLLIVADDLTGALDTGVQFAAHGTIVRVGTKLNDSILHLGAETQVLVLDAEMRHLQSAQAYDIIARITCEARDAGVPYLYKKTDSALRGNIGSELAALLAASGARELPFIPAFPQMGRVTRGGVHYVDDVPVAQSCFGTDPFEPVHFSAVKDVIASQTDTQVMIGEEENTAQNKPCIRVFDASSQEDLWNIAKRLGAEGLRFAAGCAGFASVLPEMLDMNGAPSAMPELVPGLFVICGSVNPVTRRQLDAAEQSGFAHFHLEPEQKLEPAWLESQDCEQTIKNWLSVAKENPCCILDSMSADGSRAEQKEPEGLSAEQIRVRIGDTLGTLTRRLLDEGLNATLMCTGGDTLLSLMHSFQVQELIPVCELTSGSVLTSFVYKGKQYHIITKSGGFGKPSLLCELAELIGAGKGKI